MPKETDKQPVHVILYGLMMQAYQEGRAELDRADGQRGTVKLEVEVVLGDNGRPLEANASLNFVSKRHIKDNFK